MPARIDYQLTEAELKAQDKIMLGMHVAGVPMRTIGKQLAGMDKSTVCRRLKHLTPRKTTEIYKNLRADIFAEKQRKLLMLCNGLTPKEQLTLITGVGILYDKERLERGQSTDNVAVIGVIRQLQEMHRAPVQAAQPVDKPVDK